MSHERSITVKRGDKFINVPTVFNGLRLPNEIVEGLAMQGVIPPLGGMEFGTMDEAVKEAEKRSNEYGLGPRRRK